MPDRLSKFIFGVAGIVLVSRLLGFIREMVVADKFGTSAEYDLYLVAIMLPALAYGVINFATVYLFVPYLTRKINTEKADTGWKEIWPAINLTTLASVGLVLLIYFSAPRLMKIWGANYSPQQFEQIIFLTRLTSLIILLGTSEAFMRSYLNVRKIFTYPAGGYIIFNLTSITVILIFTQAWSITAIAIGLVGGLFLQNIFLMLKVLNFKPFKQFQWKLKNQDTRYLLITASLLIVVELINRSYFLFDRHIAGQFGAGVISALNYSQILIQLPESIVGFAIGTVVFPFFADFASDMSKDEFGRIYTGIITVSLIISSMIAVIVFTGSNELVYLLFHRGEFDHRSLVLTSRLLMPHSLSIITLFIITVSLRACYALGKVKIVVLFAIIVLTVKVGGNYLFTDYVSYPGITLATALSHLLMAILVMFIVMLEIKRKNQMMILNSVLKIIIIMGIVITLIFYVRFALFDNQLYLTKPLAVAYLIGSSLVTVVVYFILGKFIGLNKVVSDWISSKKGIDE